VIESLKRSTKRKVPRSLSETQMFCHGASPPSRPGNPTRCQTLAFLLCLTFTAASSLKAEVRVLRGFTLIDGTGKAAAPNSAMVIDAGRITWIGVTSNLKIPAGAEVVDLTGRFVMPGIINLHGHLGITNGMTLDVKSYSRQTVERDLKTYAEHGVTTMLSLGLDGDQIFEIRDQQRAARPTMARVYTAGLGFVYKGGVGGGISFPGVPTPVFSTVSDVEPAVAEQARKHVDVIKFWTDDNLGKAKRMPYDICKAIIDSAHRHGVRVVAHVYYLEDAKQLTDFGIDGLAHIVRDQPVDRGFIDSMKRHNTWQVAATLTRELSLFVYAKTPDFISDPFFTRSVSADVLKTLSSVEYQQKIASDPNLEKYRQDLEIGKRNLKALADGGVKYGIGTDTGVPGRFQGYFEHLELQEMVEAGLTPMQAIVAATKSGAEFLQATDLGTLEAGKWADLIVLAKNPLNDIKNTRTVVAVYIAGNTVYKGMSQ
jgi:imidazolonepropionase-like amidohydrolase